VAKDRENKEKRLRKARETDKKEKKVKKKAIFRLHAAVTLKIEAAKKQDEILENIKITRSVITIDNKDEKITIDDLPPVDDISPPSTAPIVFDSRSKRARAGIIDYRALARLSRIREKIERLN
jgi:hypothetical protein